MEQLRQGDITLRVHDRSAQVEREAWERIRDPGNLLTDFDYLQAIEEAEVLDCEYRFLEFFAGEELACTMFGYRLTQPMSEYIERSMPRMLQPLRGKLARLSKLDILIIGSPVNLGLTISIAPTIQDETFAQIFDLLKKYAIVQGIQLVLVRDFHLPLTRIESTLTESGFSEFFNYPIGIMRVGWESFDEYLRMLKKKYRYNVRKRIGLKEECGIHTIISSHESGGPMLEEYVRLYKNVQGRSKDYPHESIGEAYHLAMGRHLKGNSFWLQYWKGEHLAGFLHFIVHRGSLVAQTIGLDYADSTEAMLYFNAYYDLIKFAIENRLQWIELGTTTYQAKSAAGFSILPQRMYLWHKNPLMRKAVAWGFVAFTDFGIQDCHHAFKNDLNQYLWDGKSRYAPEHWWSS
jgi:predicted N-acyltransferase